jgi:hypothetical protein
MNHADRQETQHDLAAPANAGAEKVAEAQQDAAAVATEGSKDIAEASKTAMSNNAVQNADVALTKAKADYKVSIELCEAQTGSARDACKSAAKAVLDAAQARVDARKPS